MTWCFPVLNTDDGGGGFDDRKFILDVRRSRQQRQDQKIAAIDRMMAKGRGFPQFEACDKFLVDLYRNRKPGQTVAYLYPQIIDGSRRIIGSE